MVVRVCVCVCTQMHVTMCVYLCVLPLYVYLCDCKLLFAYSQYIPILMDVYAKMCINTHREKRMRMLFFNFCGEGGLQFKM